MDLLLHGMRYMPWLACQYSFAPLCCIPCLSNQSGCHTTLLPDSTEWITLTSRLARTYSYVPVNIVLVSWVQTLPGQTKNKLSIPIDDWAQLCMMQCSRGLSHFGWVLVLVAARRAETVHWGYTPHPKLSSWRIVHIWINVCTVFNHTEQFYIRETAVK